MIQFNFTGKAKAIEILTEDEFAILTSQNELLTDNSSCLIEQDFRHPLVRRINENEILIVETRCDEFDKNARVYSTNGELISEFAVGDAVHDIIAFERKLVFSYQDEGIMEKKSISKEGLTVFNTRGKMLFGFNSDNQNDYEVWDCKHITTIGKTKVLLVAYGQLPILEIDRESVFYK